MCRDRAACVRSCTTTPPPHNHAHTHTHTIMRPCEGINVRVVCAECVGAVGVCVCVWVSNIPIHQSHKWATPLPGETNVPCPALTPLPLFPLESPWGSVRGTTIPSGHLCMHLHVHLTRECISTDRIKLQ